MSQTTYEKSQKSHKDRYQEIVEDLANLPEWELRSFCLKEAYIPVIQTVLDYKKEVSNSLSLQNQAILK